MTQQSLDRIERLRSAALTPVVSGERFYLYFYRSFAQNDALPFETRYARAFAYAMSRTDPVIEPDELIVGQLCHPFVTEAERAEWDSLRPLRESVETYEGQDSHMAIDYPRLLSCGTEGVKLEVLQRLRNATAPERLFLEACAVCLDAVADFSDRYAQKAETMAGSEPNPDRRKELLEIARVCRQVPRFPASSFREAVQSVSFMTYCISFHPLRTMAIQQFQLGRPDRYLLPYYTRDVAAGVLDREGAQLLLDCLGIQINHRVCRGLSSGYMLGGRDAQGVPVANALTEMGMQVIDDIRLVYPSVGLCVCRDTPEKYLHKACEILSHGRSHPAIFNDDLIAEGLSSYGIPESWVHEYIHSTCVEITPVGRSNCWVASPYTNMPQLLLEVLRQDYASEAELMAAFFARLDESIRRNCESQLRDRAKRLERGFCPLVSCFVHSCIPQGRDIERGGADFNWIMPSFVGIANLVDGLFVIRTLIFEKKELTFDRLRRALEMNFVGEEALRLRMLEQVPKYGNDIPQVDAYFARITEHLVSECAKYRDDTRRFRLVPSVFCWIMHEVFGRDTGATPDGRLAGFPLGDGSGPCQGREKCGPTASVLSSTSWSHSQLIGGVAVNMKFNKKTFCADSCRKLQTLIRTYLERGGFELQINVVDRETLLAAQQQPELYRDLVVRIGGYSDYFVCLSPQMQAEVLLRTAHE